MLPAAPGVIFRLALAVLGASAAIFGKWVERVGPPTAPCSPFTAACFFAGGFLVALLMMLMNRFGNGVSANGITATFVPLGLISLVFGVTPVVARKQTPRACSKRLIWILDHWAPAQAGNEPSAASACAWSVRSGAFLSSVGRATSTMWLMGLCGGQASG